MTENKMFRQVKISSMMLDKETFEPYKEVTMRIYPEIIQDIHVMNTSEKEFLLVGQQLCEALEVRRGSL